MRDRSYAARVLAFTGFALLLGGCAGGPKIVINSDPAADWSRYQTFSFFDPLGTDKDSVRTILSNQLVASTTRELEARGMTRRDENPDVLVNFIVSTKETVRSRPSTSIGVHHGIGGYSTWGGYSVGVSTTDIVQSTEGTLVIDVVDRESNQLIWEAAASKRITEKMRRNQQQVVDEAVIQLFAGFPKN